MRFSVAKRSFGYRIVIAAVALAAVSSFSASAQLQSPEEFFGHEVGADYKLIPWPRIVEYYEHMAANSDRIRLRELGTTTEGLPFLFAEISDAETIANLQPHRDAQRKIADPRLIGGEAERERLIFESKVPIMVNCQLHSNETAGSQMGMEMTYTLLTDESRQMQEIREHTIILMVPCANPDGQKLIAEWYDASIGTPWEGYTTMPRLYQKYAGHDNNRDWFMLNLTETRFTTEVLYREWFPTIVWDVHQMGNGGARLFVPPFHDPKNLNVHPGIDQTLLIIGGHMAGDLAKKGMQGVVHSAIYDNWWAGGFRTTPYRHNMVGILTEAASVNLASPVFQRKSELSGYRRGLPEYEAVTNFPDPWPGGWWRLRDIVEYELEIGWSLFQLAARYKDRFQSNYIQFGEEAIELGQTEPPYAWIVPEDQRDPGSAYEMLERLHATAIEVHRAEEDFTADGVEYSAGTYIMYTAQPYRPHLMDMMERQVYPDREMYPGGPAEPPYDMAGWTLPLQMGVEHVEVAQPFEAQAALLETIEKPVRGMPSGPLPAYVVQTRMNDDYTLMSRLWQAGVPFKIAGSDAAPQAVPGSIVIEDARSHRGKVEDAITGLATDIDGLESVSSELEARLHTARKPRAALYHPYAASMEEGWTRLALDNFEIPYESIYNEGIRAGSLAERYDCIILPSVGPGTILNGYPDDVTAPAYAGGIGEKGVTALQEFVEQGGTLVCMDQSTNIVIDHFNVPVENLVRGKPSEEFFCPGSVLRLSMDTSHPLGFGMPEWYAGYFARSQAFAIKEAANKDDPRDPANRFPATVVSRFSDTVVLESGWIRGEELIQDQAAIVDVEYGKGNIYLLGISVQRRGQPHGTFKILFNAILASALEDAEA